MAADHGKGGPVLAVVYVTRRGWAARYNPPVFLRVDVTGAACFELGADGVVIAVCHHAAAITFKTKSMML